MNNYIERLLNKLSQNIVDKNPILKPKIFDINTWQILPYNYSSITGNRTIYIRLVTMGHERHMIHYKIHYEYLCIKEMYQVGKIFYKTRCDDIWKD